MARQMIIKTVYTGLLSSQIMFPTKTKHQMALVERIIQVITSWNPKEIRFCTKFFSLLIQTNAIHAVSILHTSFFHLPFINKMTVFFSHWILFSPLIHVNQYIFFCITYYMSVKPWEPFKCLGMNSLKCLIPYKIPSKILYQILLFLCYMNQTNGLKEYIKPYNNRSTHLLGFLILPIRKYSNLTPHSLIWVKWVNQGS